MPKQNSTYICQQCGYRSPTFLGKCPECDSWNSLVETIERVLSVKVQVSGEKAEVVNIFSIQKTNYKRIDTGLEEFNRVLGGGIVQGSVILLCGDPGIGKSTLLTQVALNIESRDPSLASLDASRSGLIAQDDRGEVLYIAGEESAQQIKLRVDRMKHKSNLAVLNEINVDFILEAISTTKPKLAIIDSIQTLQTEDLSSVAGSVGQVRECTARIQRLAKNMHIPIFLVGHVNKEGMIAGPKTLEHMVDAVISLEGDASSNFRILRGSKNRFGPTDEVGIFEMDETGLKEVQNPSGLFLNHKTNSPGSVVAATINGTRPILVEIQALVTKSFLPMPRRTSAGVDNNRLQLLVAVLTKRLGLSLFDKDIFVNVTGGLRVTEPACDLAICMAIISSLQDKIIPAKTCFVGEVGLLGEIREVRFMEKREREAKKLSFNNIVSSKNKKSIFEAAKILIQ